MSELFIVEKKFKTRNNVCSFDFGFIKQSLNILNILHIWWLGVSILLSVLGTRSGKCWDQGAAVVGEGHQNKLFKGSIFFFSEDG